MVEDKINIRYRFNIRYSGKKLMSHSFHLISQHKFVSLFDKNETLSKANTTIFFEVTFLSSLASEAM